MDESIPSRRELMHAYKNETKIRDKDAPRLGHLLEAHAIHECEYHGWDRDQADPHAREHAVAVAQRQPPAGLSPEAAVAEVRDVLDSIGDTCPECPPE